MPGLTKKGRVPSNRGRRRKSPKPDEFTMADAPKDLASLVRGLYHRIATQLDLDPSYVSRVARNERKSEIVADALRREIRRIVQIVSKRSGRSEKSKKTEPK